MNSSEKIALEKGLPKYGLQISIDEETPKQNIEFLKNIWNNKNLKGINSYFIGGSTSSRENKEKARKINLETFLSLIAKNEFWVGKIIIGRFPEYNIRCAVRMNSGGLDVVIENICDLTEENYSFVKNLYEDIYKRDFITNMK